LVIALVWGITIAGCDNGSTSSKRDTWSDVTDISQMDGTWKGTYSQKDIPVMDFITQMGLIMDPMIQFMLVDMKVTTDADITITINAREKTQATSVTTTATFSGQYIDLFWMALQQNADILESLAEEGIIVTLNDAQHAISTSTDLPAETMSEDEIADLINSGLQINQKGNKIKVPADIILDGTPEIVFDKQ